MAKFRYTATDSDRLPVQGEIEASTVAEARGALEERELTGIELVELTAAQEEQDAPAPPAAPASLSSSESGELARHLAHIGSSDLPLASGLRAAAAECEHHRVARSLLQIAERVDQGQRLEEIVDSSPGLFPRHVGGLVIAAARTGKLGSALSELLEHQRAARSLRVAIARGFAYPIFVVCLATLVLTFMVFAVSDTLRRMFDEFELSLPMPTRLLFWWRDTGVWIVLALIASLLVAAVVYRVVRGRARWAQLKASIPFVGPLSYWSGLAEWCSLLSVLLKHQIALPDALRLSADGVDNAYIGRISAGLAESSSAGKTLSQILAASKELPLPLVPLIRWGEQVGLLNEAFATGKELFDRWVRIRALMLHSILPPLLFVAIAAGVLLAVVALFSPLTSLISSLS